MTTVRDYLNDLIAEVIEKANENLMRGSDPAWISEDQKEDLLEEYTGIIKERLIG